MKKAEKLDAPGWSEGTGYAVNKLTAFLHWRDVYYLGGMGADHRPCVFTSLLGNIWEPANLAAFYPIAMLPEEGAVIAMIPDEDEGILHIVCTSGQIITLSDCPKCTKIRRGSEGIIDKAYPQKNGIKLLLKNGKTEYIEMEQICHERLSWTYAREHYGTQGILVRLLSDEGLKLPGFLNQVQVDLEDLTEKLENQPKDRPLLFICGIGTQADCAAHMMRKRGYKKAYSLGGVRQAAHVK